MLVGLALGIGFGGSSERPQGGGGGADPSRSGDPDRRQSGGDLPPMDFEGRAQVTSSGPSKASTTAKPSTVADTSAPAASVPERSVEVTSAVGVTPTPEPPALPLIPELPASSFVEPPSSSAPPST